MADVRTWNYRVIEYADGDGFGLHEVHYLNGDIDSWTERAIVVGETVQSISNQLSQMRVDARRRAVLFEPLTEQPVEG